MDRTKISSVLILNPQLPDNTEFNSYPPQRTCGKIFASLHPPPPRKTSVSPATLKFGPCVVDLASGEVRRNESRVRLQEKPLRVLTLLADRQGQLVTREELRKHLWPDETFVDFESGLNTAVSKLREALSDNAEKPRYIETIPRRGYRFLGKAEVTGNGSSTIPALGPAVAPADEALRGQDTVPIHARATARSSWKVQVLRGALVAAAAFALWWFTPLPPPAVLHTDQITVTSRIDTPVRPVSDGERIYYIERDGGHWNLMRTSLGGGDGQRVNVAAGNAMPLDIAPDKSSILIGTFEKRGDENQLWTMPVEGGAATRLGNMTAGSAMYSPDAKTIAYTRGNSIWMMDADGGHPRLVLNAAGAPTWLAWAPDGKRLRFTIGFGTGDESASIWEISRDGTGLHKVLADWWPSAWKCCGAWTPDGRYFVFSAASGGPANMWALREHGASWRRSPPGPFQLTSGPASSGTLDRPGSSILFYNGVWRDETERLDVKTGKFSPLLPNAHAHLRSFSSDGKWIAYIDSRGSLVRSQTDGTQPVVLAAAEIYHPYFPRWSPDGRWIVFGASLAGKPPNSFLVPASGGHPEPLLPGDLDMRDADWSNDGRKLVLSRVVGPKDSDPRELVLVDFETRRTEKLPGSENLFASRWSLDGRFISATVDDQSQLRLWDFSSKKWSLIARGTALGISVWSPDSRYLYFQDLLSAGQSLRRYDVQTRRVELVAEFSEILNARAADRCAIEGVTPDGAPFIGFNRGAFDLFSDALRLP